MEQAAATLRNECLRLLAERDHSRKELAQKLLHKGYDRLRIETVLDELADEGLQSDARYAESYARARILKGYGPVFIGYALRQNGIEPGSLPSFDLQTLADSIAPGGWSSILQQVYLKKYGADGETDRNERAKRSRFLQQRGFTPAMIAELFKNPSNTF